MQVIFMRNIRIYLLTGFVFAAVLGTLSHFFYDWSGENPVVALVSPVNESTWEHMKLVFFPILIWSFFLPAKLAESHPSLRPALLLGGIAGTLLVPVLFYTYSGILGRNIAWIDIAIFFIAVAAAFGCAWLLRDSPAMPDHRHKKTAIYILTVLLVILFFLFTFMPPDIGLFAEP